MSYTHPGYLLEFRCQGKMDWQDGSNFRCLNFAKQCVDATLRNFSCVLEGRVFDRKLMAYRYYRAAYPFKP